MSEFLLGVVVTLLVIVTGWWLLQKWDEFWGDGS